MGLFVFAALNGVGSGDFNPSSLELGSRLILLLFLYSLLLSYLLLALELSLLTLRENYSCVGVAADYSLIEHNFGDESTFLFIGVLLLVAHICYDNFP